VQRGDTLWTIAARHGVTVSSIVRWNALQKDARLAPGRKLGIPLPASRASHAGAKTATSAPEEHSTARRPAQTWRDFTRAPERAGWVSLRSYTRSFAGNALESGAEQRIAEVMTPPNRDAPPIDPRLIQLITLVSDTFGGRPILVVSGYRPGGGHSWHARAQAIDLSIEGVPNWALRDFLLTLDRVGVGYYPNSHHVHLDVRERSTSWVDLSRPGRRARYLRPKRASKRR
jgi:LysM repeat protein